MDTPVDPFRYFRDVDGSVVSLQVFDEPLPNGDRQIRQVIRSLGWLEGELGHRDEENIAAELTATVGIVDPQRIIGLCQIVVQHATTPDATARFLLVKLVERMRQFLGEHEIHCAVVETIACALPSAQPQCHHYGFRVDAGQRNPILLHRVFGSGPWNSVGEFLVEIRDPQKKSPSGDAGAGNAADNLAAGGWLGDL